MNKEISQRIEELLERVKQMRLAINLEQKEKHLVELDFKMAEPDFWQSKLAPELAKKAGNLKNEIDKWNELERQLVNCQQLVATEEGLLELGESNDSGLKEDITKQLASMQTKLESLETASLLADKHDSANAILSINAGAGGDDSQDWAEALSRMYLRFIEKQNWSANILNKSDGQTAGIKSITIEIIGFNAYGYLKAEAGVHRLVRLSPFDADNARHTSFAMVEVVPELDEEEIEIKEDDLRIDVYRSSGKGGQSVNTTDSAVRITHLPTGIVAICQNERSQLQNKAKARQYLFGKLTAYYQAAREEERLAIRGELTEAAWGNQIRSYVLHPYKMVKDHRTKMESSDPDKVLDGDIMPFIEAYLKMSTNKS
jgi:peptide chain release factor 2